MRRLLLGLLLLLPARLQSAAPEGTAASADLTGTWAQVVVHRSLSAIPIVGDVASETTTRLLVTLSQEGELVKARAKVCGMRIEGSKLVRTSIPPALVRAMPEQLWHTRVSATEGRLELAPWSRWDVLGARLQEPSRDALPTEASDARVFDQDGDGKPGVTVAVRGMIDGEIFVTQKGWSELRPDRVTADSISGSVRWRQTQTILGASSRFLSSGPETRPDPKPAANWFSARRVEAGASCAEVSALPASFFRR
jgi:RNase P/RNase MRP subunit p29